MSRARLNWVTLVLGERGCSGPSAVQESGLEEFKAGPTIHAAFQSFEPIDLPFDLPIAVRRFERGSNRVKIAVDPHGERLKFREATLSQFCQPHGQAQGGLPPEQRPALSEELFHTSEF